MRDLNIEFMDLYKRIDRFIKDAYSSSEGVSEYIRLMERHSDEGNIRVYSWKSDYKNLKHARWIRNQLAHEVDYDSDICSDDDYEWLEDFYNRLFSSDDPLSLLRKTEQKTDNVKTQNYHFNYSYSNSHHSYNNLRPTKHNNNNLQPIGCSSAMILMIICTVVLFVSLHFLTII